MSTCIRSSTLHTNKLLQASSARGNAPLAPRETPCDLNAPRNESAFQSEDGQGETLEERMTQQNGGVVSLDSLHRSSR